jgi:hypothetical protein
MLPEENEVYGLYTPPYQQRPFEPVAVLDQPAVTHTPAEQDTSPLPSYPPGPKTSPPPQKWAGRGGNTSHLRKFASQTRQIRKLKLMAFTSAI